MTDLVIDQLARRAEQAPDAPLFPGRSGDGWPLLTNAEAWARSGAVASWLIAQGFGPLGNDGRARSLAVQAAPQPLSARGSRSSRPLPPPSAVAGQVPPS